MAKEKNVGSIIAGLDVGTTKVTTIVAEVLSTKEINIIGEGTSSSQGVKRGVVVDIDSCIKSIERSVEKAERMSGVEIDKVYLGIGGEHISSSNSHGVIAISGGRGEVIRSDVERVQEAARIIPLPSDRDIIHLIPRDYIIDGQDGIKNPVGMSGTRLEINAHIVTGGVSFIQNLLKCVQRVGLVVSGMVLHPLASSEAVLSQDEKEIGAVLIDIGGGTTDIAIFLDGSIVWTKILPIGGSNIDKDIAYGLPTTLSEAERIKKEYGVALSSLADNDNLIKIKEVTTATQREIPQTLLAEIIEPRVVEIFELVKSEIGKSTFQDMIPAGIILTGGVSLLRGIVELAKDIFQAPCRVGYPTNIGGLSEQIKSPIYSTGVGLIIYGAKRMQKAEETKRTTKKVYVIDKVINWIKDFIWPQDKP